MDPEGNMHDSFSSVDEKHHKKVYETNFPPANASELGLNKWYEIHISRVTIP